MSEIEDLSLLDLIYSTALDARLWERVMERFADMVGGDGGFLSSLDVVDNSGSAFVARIDPSTTSAYFSHYADRNPLHSVANPTAYLETWAPRILTDEDWIPKADLMRTEFYNDFMRPQDIHSVLMIRLATRASQVCVLNISRSQQRGQFTGQDLERAARLHPHLVRAFGLGQKLAHTRNLHQGLAAALDTTSDAMLLLDASGRLGHANRAAEALLAAKRGLCVTGGRLRAVQSDADERLQALIGSAARSVGGQVGGGSMDVSPGTGLPLSLAVDPLHSAELAIFGSQLCVIVCASDPNRSAGLPQARLRELFGLTTAEVRVALHLLGGASPRDASERLGVSFHTVRRQIQSLFEKTGTSRQSELVMLLMKTRSTNMT